MDYYNVKLPSLEADKTYYLTYGYGGVATFKGSDINIIGKIVRTPNGPDFEVLVKVNGMDRDYTLESIHVKHGNLLQPIALMQQPLRLGFKTRYMSKVVVVIDRDMSVRCPLWVCDKDYTPRIIVSLGDAELVNRGVYKVDDDGTFWSTAEKPEFPETDIYRYESDVRFYCKCGAVSGKSMADIMCVSDEELDNINTMLTELKEYMAAHNIIMLYDSSDNKTRVCRNSGLPEGYSIAIEDDTNGHPWSMQVPVAAIRNTKDVLYDNTNDGWNLQLNYKKPEPEAEEEAN